MNEEIKGILLEGLEGEELKAMELAIEKGEYYAIAVPCAAGSYCIGNIEDEAPSLFATKESAELENEDVKSEFQDQVDAGDRTDAWDGVVMACKWDGEGSIILLNDDGAELQRECWRSISGL